MLLAALLAPEHLPKEVIAGVSDSSNTVYFSSASILEIASKRSLNRADFDFSPEDIHRLALDTGFTELTVNGGDSLVRVCRTSYARLSGKLHKSSPPRLLPLAKGGWEGSAFGRRHVATRPLKDYIRFE